MTSSPAKGAKTGPDPWHTLLAVDFDKWAARTYAANFPDVDVRCASVADELDQLPYADVILGGPPCQPHSLAGKRQGADDSRDGGDSFASAVERKRPRMFLMENVLGMMSTAGGSYYYALANRLLKAGYCIQHRAYNAADFGVPQQRFRSWTWGIRDDVRAVHQWPLRTHAEHGDLFGGGQRWVTIRQATGIERWMTECNTSSSKARKPRSGDVPCVTICGGGNTMGGLMAIAEPGSEPWRLDRPCNAVLASEDKGARHQKFNPKRTPARASDTLWRATGRRRFTVAECLRLQSAPDDFVWPAGITKRAQYSIVGNGWASVMGRVFGDALRLADPDSKTVIDLFCGGGLGAVGFHGRCWTYQPQSIAESA